ncbi:unnamed protein product, partial [Discosporangium mesarthrocarpum]
GLAESTSIKVLDVSGHGMGDSGGVLLGNALRKNRSLTSLQFDENGLTLEGFKAFRGCLYGNKKLVEVGAPTKDL